jgi:hypothetical protein
MNVYQRPLFRQMGGPVAPGMAAQEAMPDPAMAQQLQSAEQSTAANMQRVGQGYVSQTMGALDAAETPKDLIDAIRGNQMPLEARFQELAQLVGEQDAMRTPESVLALVQPTIMMTEQGAMDSGIGELMQGLVGQVDMETAGGQPTPMGQGVGSLMMAGAPAEQPMGVGQPPVANFRQGGVVQRFQTGGEASRLQQLYSEMLPTYQSILGDGGEQRRLTQAQILFDIADRAGAFAAGVDPRTGQRVQGSPAAQLAAAASGLGGQIGKRLGSQEEQDRALRLAALQAAQGEYSAERAAARAAAAAGANRGIGALYDLRDSEGNLIRRVPVSNRGELDRLIAEAAEIGGDFRPSQFEATGLTDEDYFTKFGMTRLAFQALPVEDQRRLQGLAPELGADVKGIPRDVFDRLSPENQERVILGDTSPGSVNGIPRDIFNSLSQADQQKILGTAPETAADVKGIPRDVFNTLSAEDQQRVILGDTSPGSVNGIPRDIFNSLSQADQQKILGTAPEAARDVKGIPAAVFSTLSPEDQRRVLVGDTSPGSVNGIPRDIFNTLSPADQQKILGTAPETAADVKGIPRDVFNTLSAEDQRRVLVGDTSPGAVNGIPRDIFNTLSPADQQKILGTAQEAPSGEFIKIRMPDGTEETVRSDSPEADRLTALGGQRVAITAAPTEDPLVNPSSWVVMPGTKRRRMKLRLFKRRSLKTRAWCSTLRREETSAQLLRRSSVSRNRLVEMWGLLPSLPSQKTSRQWQAWKKVLRDWKSLAGWPLARARLR